MKKNIEYIGVVPIKSNSNRFPNKNISLLNKKPLFAHSIDVLFENNNVQQIFIPTDSDFVKEYVRLNYDNTVQIIHRNINISNDDDPLLLVLKFVHYSIKIQYDKMVVIMANCPGHSSSFLDKSISLMKKSNSLEFRSFNSEGEENGLMIFDKKVIESNVNISSHICSATINSAEEFHYKSDLDDFKQKYFD